MASQSYNRLKNEAKKSYGSSNKGAFYNDRGSLGDALTAFDDGFEEGFKLAIALVGQAYAQEIERAIKES